MRVFAMKLHRGKDFNPVRVANTIVKAFTVYADGERIAEVTDNYYSLVKLPIEREVSEIRIEWNATNGAEGVNLFSCDLM